MEEEGVKIIIDGSNGEEEFVLDFRVPDDMPTRFANEVAVQALHTEFVFSFFEVRLPIVRTGRIPSEIKKEINPVCVGRLAISVDRMPDLIKALQDRYTQFTADRENLLESAESNEEE